MQARKQQMGRRYRASSVGMECAFWDVNSVMANSTAWINLMKKGAKSTSTCLLATDTLSTISKKLIFKSWNHVDNYFNILMYQSPRKNISKLSNCMWQKYKKLSMTLCAQFLVNPISQERFLFVCLFFWGSLLDYHYWMSCHVKPRFIYYQFSHFAILCSTNV